MIRRAFWVSVGAGATIYALRKLGQVNAAAAHLTPAGIASALADLAGSLRGLGGQLSQSMAAHEQAILDALTGTGEPRPRRAAPHDPDAYV